MKRMILGLAALAWAAAPTMASIVITPETNATNLTNALAINPGNALNITTATLSGHSLLGATSSGIYNITTSPDTYGITQNGIVLSTGDVNDYETGPDLVENNTTSYGPAATAAQEALLDPITGNLWTHFDVTQLTINFNLPAEQAGEQLFFDVVFGSDEFLEYVNTDFIDGFGIYLNGTNLAFYGGSPMSINHPFGVEYPGTELDGVIQNIDGSAVLRIETGGLNVGANELIFIVGDASDSSFDTTVYISGLGVPEPSTLGLLVIGAAGLISRRRRN